MGDGPEHLGSFTVSHLVTGQVMLPRASMLSRCSKKGQVGWRASVPTTLHIPSRTGSQHISTTYEPYTRLKEEPEVLASPKPQPAH